MNLNKYNNYIFDFDGTIATLNIDWSSLKEEINILCKKYNININQKLNIKIDLLKEKIDNKILFTIIKKYEQKNNKVDFIPINKILNFIDELDYLFVISNNLSSTVKRALLELNIYKESTIIIGIDSVNKSKPNIEAYKKLEPFLNKGSSIYIGDRESDLEFANNCKINFKYMDEL